MTKLARRTLLAADGPLLNDLIGAVRSPLGAQRCRDVLLSTRGEIWMGGQRGGKRVDGDQMNMNQSKAWRLYHLVKTLI